MNDFYYLRKRISDGETVEVGIRTHLYQVKKKGAVIEVFDGKVKKAIPNTKYMNITTFTELKKTIEKIFK